MRRPGRAALLLLVLACALAGPAVAQDIPAHIHPLSIYRLADPAGDVAIETDPLVSQVVPPPNFDDIDITSVDLYEDFGPEGDQPGTLVIWITTAAALQDGADLQVSFNVTQGPTSLPTSTASGQSYNFTATPSQPGATSARVSVPRAALGAVGGDLLANLTVTSTRFDPGDLPVAQDDSTGTDQAPDAGTTAAPFTFFRAPSASLFTVTVTAIDGTPGDVRDFPAGTGQADITLTIRNDGLDAEGYGLSITSLPPLADAPVLTQELRVLDGGASETRTIPVSLAGIVGTVRVTFTVTGERGGQATDSASLTVAAPPIAQRQVVPVGLDFLTPAAESAGFDDAFGKYAELALLALILLLAILAIYLLLALAPSTLKGTAADEAPPLADAAATPAGPTTAPPKVASAPATAPIPPAPVPGLSIQSVTHTPDAPEEGEEVSTEVVLRNGGSTRQVRIVLARDGTDVDEADATLPAFATKAVRLSWTAGPGENRVKVRVLPA